MNVRPLFSVLVGAGVFLLAGVSSAVFEVSHVGLLVAVVGGALAGWGAHKAWPWIDGRSKFERLVAAGLNTSDDNWVDDGSGERPGWNARDLQSLSPHNAWLTAPEERGFVAADTAEIPAPAVRPRQAVVYDLGGFNLKVRRPRRRNRTGAR